LTCLGVRHTTGSKDKMYPERKLLVQSFNRLHSALTEEMRVMHGNNIPVLTAGARALCKHANRNPCEVWGQVEGIRDEQKNIHANKVMNKLLD
jgi:hypothetical protein